MQSESHGITAALQCLHMKSGTAREREGVSVGIRCAQITRCEWCAWCAATIPITHPHCHNSMQMACESEEREKRGEEEREEGSSLIPAIAHPAGTYHLIPSPSLLPSPSSSLSFTPSTHTHTITSTGLAYNHLHITAPLAQPTSPLTHTNPKPTPMHVPVHRGNAAAAAAAARLLVFLTITSSSSPPPPACHTCTHKQQVVHV